MFAAETKFTKHKSYILGISYLHHNYYFSNIHKPFSYTKCSFDPVLQHILKYM